MRDQDEITVSVIMPSYNASEYIKTAIDSALNQNVESLEIIVVDDGSTDDTMQLLQSYGDRIVVYQQENAGAGAARNYAAKMAKGEWLAFLDADDIWEPGKIEAQLAQFSYYTWSHTDSVFIGFQEDGTVRGSDLCPKCGGQVMPVLVVNNFVGTSTVMVRREAFFEVGGFDQSLRALQDWDLWLKLGARYELGYLPEVYIQYRVHSLSTSRSARKTIPYHLEIIRRTFAPGGTGESLLHLRRKALAESFGVLSLIAEESEDPFFALSCALRAAWNQPSRLYRWKCVARIIVGIPAVLLGRSSS